MLKTKFSIKKHVYTLQNKFYAKVFYKTNKLTLSFSIKNEIFTLRCYWQRIPIQL